MQDELVKKVSDLMELQTASYESLSAATRQLSAALIRGEAEQIESMTRAGEGELNKMRARLVEITSTLSAFADQRSRQGHRDPIAPEIKSKFETSSTQLVAAAKAFQTLSRRTAGLALGGSSFAVTCLQSVGMPAMTYNAPVIRASEGAA